VALQRSAIELRPHGGCGTDSNLHSTKAPGYGRLGFPIPYTPMMVNWLQVRESNAAQKRLMRPPGPRAYLQWRRTEVSIPTPFGAHRFRDELGRRAD
jgi:hypothetical protein